MAQRRECNPDEYVDGVASFADFVKELEPLTSEYEQAVDVWVVAGEVRKESKEEQLRGVRK